MEAVTVVVPGATNVARPGVVLENVTTDVLPEVQVAELVTSAPFSAAKNCVVGVEASVNV